MILKVPNTLYSYQILNYGDASVCEEDKHLQRTEQRVGIKWVEKLILPIKMYLVFIFLTVDNITDCILYAKNAYVLFGYKILYLENAIPKHNLLKHKWTSSVIQLSKEISGCL